MCEVGEKGGGPWGGEVGRCCWEEDGVERREVGERDHGRGRELDRWGIEMDAGGVGDGAEQLFDLKKII